MSKPKTSIITEPCEELLDIWFHQEVSVYYLNFEDQVHNWSRYDSVYRELGKAPKYLTDIQLKHYTDERRKKFKRFTTC